MSTKPLVLTFYRSGPDNRWWWSLSVAANGEKIAQSSQGAGFANRKDCEHNAALALDGPNAIVGSFEGTTYLPHRDDIVVVHEG